MTRRVRIISQEEQKDTYAKIVVLISMFVTNCIVMSFFSVLALTKIKNGVYLYQNKSKIGVHVSFLSWSFLLLFYNWKFNYLVLGYRAKDKDNHARYFLTKNESTMGSLTHSLTCNRQTKINISFCPKE